MLILLHRGENGRVRPGDAVFCWDEKSSDFSLHVGIHIGEASETDDCQGLFQVRGVPWHLGPVSNLGVATWGEPDEYRVDIIGAQVEAENVDPTQVKEVRFLSEMVELEHSILREAGTRCGWRRQVIIDPNRRILDGHAVQNPPVPIAASPLTGKPQIGGRRTETDPSSELKTLPDAGPVSPTPEPDYHPE